MCFLLIQMGQQQSQLVERFINNNVNTTAIANVISNYATTTNAITTNTQDLCVRITATGDIDFGQGGFTASQEIESLIDVQAMVDRADKDQLVNDLQRTITTELQDAIERTTGGLDIFEIPVNQQLRTDVINNLNSYVNQTVNTQTVDNVLLSASNVQRGCYEFSAANVRGPLVISQRIQSNIMADNLVRQVMERALENREVQELATRAEGELVSENRAEIPSLGNLFGGGLGTWLFYIFGALVIVGSLVLAYFLPVGIRAKVITAAIGILLGVVLIVVGIIRGRASTNNTNTGRRTGKVAQKKVQIQDKKVKTV